MKTTITLLTAILLAYCTADPIAITPQTKTPTVIAPPVTPPVTPQQPIPVAPPNVSPTTPPVTPQPEPVQPPATTSAKYLIMITPDSYGYTMAKIYYGTSDIINYDMRQGYGSPVIFSANIGSELNIDIEFEATGNHVSYDMIFQLFKYKDNGSEMELITNITIPKYTKLPYNLKYVLN